MVNLDIFILQNNWEIIYAIMLVHLLLYVSILQDSNIFYLLLMSLGKIF